MALNHNLRFSNFTSSEIVALTSLDKKGGVGKPFFSYLEKKKFESRLGQRIGTETSGKPLSWGKVGEQWVFNQTDISWELTSDETLPHPTIPFWSGSKDCIKEVGGIRTVGEIKAPYTKLSYCRLADACIANSTDLLRQTDDGEKYYFQIISNAIINNCKRGELIIGMPYIDELKQFKDIIDKINSEDVYEYYWIEAALNSGKYQQLPHLIRDTYYKNHYTLNFEIPQSDIDFLTERVLMANEIRNNWGVPEIKKS